MPRGQQGLCRCGLGDEWTTASRTRLLVLQVYFWTKNAADRQPEPDLGLLLLTPEGWRRFRGPWRSPSPAARPVGPAGSEQRTRCSSVPRRARSLEGRSLCVRRSSLNI